MIKTYEISSMSTQHTGLGLAKQYKDANKLIKRTTKHLSHELCSTCSFSFFLFFFLFFFFSLFSFFLFFSLRWLMMTMIRTQTLHPLNSLHSRFGCRYFIHDFLDLSKSKKSEWELQLHHVVVLLCFGSALLTKQYIGYNMVSKELAHFDRHS